MRGSRPRACAWWPPTSAAAKALVPRLGRTPTLADLAQMSIDLGVKVNKLGDLDHPFLKIAHYGGYLEVGNIES